MVPLTIRLKSMNVLKRVEKFVNTVEQKGNLVSPKVPPDQRFGPSNDELFSWAPIPSTVKEADIVEIKRRINFVFPPLFRAYLLYKCLVETEFLVWLPSTPSDAPLASLERNLEYMASDPFFTEHGLIPFAYGPDFGGPVCFETGSCDPKGERLVVAVDMLRLTEKDYRGGRKWGSFELLLDEIEEQLLST